ncbi:acyl-CoA thioesterase [Moritella marina ATCC 15381]|uniref:Acyl-CoA thioesterase n=1 Tax=Moritella marina ATCC 15381 TaxID=1202962 RepID=A0A5J6WFW1_MORMI|nr:acyl-CoA thioesterase [Moritella marina]QFI36847.1 acyl-CoA thioesterase [Moritella marina ATCC 15381]
MISELIRCFYLRNKQTNTKGFFDTITRSFRVGLRHIDFNLHINNAKYLMFLEKARWDHAIQTNTFNPLLKHKLNFIVAGVEVGYIREIGLFKKFDVETTYLGWDDKYFYLEQKCIVNGKLCNYSLVKAVFVQKGKVVSPNKVMEILPMEQRPQQLPEHMQIWKDLGIAKRNFTTCEQLDKAA